MPEIDSHAPGEFCWVELATSDQRAGVQFYRDLLGWDVRETPIGPTEVYSMFLLRGRDAAAAYTLQDDEKQMGIPPHWNVYVNVENAEGAVAKAKSLGAEVLVEPFDVMEHGRMAVLRDPTGAVFQVWQPKQHVGIRVRQEPGALCWTELTTRDPARAEAFYTALFGWSAKKNAPDAPMPYTEFSVAGRPGIGMMEMPQGMPAGMPSYWMPYFQVADIQAATDKAKSLGADVLVGPHDVPGGGKFTIFKDPQGAICAVYQS